MITNENERAQVNILTFGAVREKRSAKSRPAHLTWLLFGLVGLAGTYTLQHWLNPYDWVVSGLFIDYSDRWSDIPNLKPGQFVVNKTFRYLLNDLFSIAFLYGWFGRKDFTRLAFAVMGVGLLVLLPLYFGLVSLRPEGWSNLISHLHRIVMNPVFMMLLFPAFLVYERNEKAETRPE